MIYFSILNTLDKIKRLFSNKDFYLNKRNNSYTSTSYIKKTPISVWDTNEVQLLQSQKKEAEEKLKEQENG